MFIFTTSIRENNISTNILLLEITNIYTENYIKILEHEKLSENLIGLCQSSGSLDINVNILSIKCPRNFISVYHYRLHSSSYFSNIETSTYVFFQFV